jgi:hypothetical protein
MARARVWAFFMAGVLLQLAQLEAQEVSHAFLLKTGRWASHPETGDLKVGGGVVVALMNDGSALRYSGEIWEIGPSKKYELQPKSGFVADIGKWKEYPNVGLKVTFNKTMAQNTVPAPGNPSETLKPGACNASRTLASAREIVCGTLKLRLVHLSNIPASLLSELLSLPGDR